MTKNQERLLAEARRACDYLNRLATGQASRGMYEGIEIGRDLRAAIDAVDHDVIQDASTMLEAGRH